MVLAVRDLPQGAANPAYIVMLTANGQAIASTNFDAPATPPAQGCQSVTLPAVRVAAGAAYFADSAGAIHRLAPDDSITQVATFPISASSFLSFAVSPDGRKLIAIVITSPPSVGGHYSLDLEEADAGAPTRKVLHKDLGAVLLPGPTLIAGWDDGGPVATLNSNLCIQNDAPSTEYFGRPLIHLAADGTHLDEVGGSGCFLPVDELANGTVVCVGSDGSSFTIRNRGGGILWQAALDGVPIDPHVSPDGGALVVEASDVELFRVGAQQAVSLTQTTNSPFIPLGWFGNDYLVVVYNAGTRLGLISMNNLNGVINIGKTVAPSATVTSVGSIGL